MINCIFYISYQLPIQRSIANYAPLSYYCTSHTIAKQQLYDNPYNVSQLYVNNGKLFNLMVLYLCIEVQSSKIVYFCKINN